MANFETVTKPKDNTNLFKTDPFVVGCQISKYSCRYCRAFLFHDTDILNHTYHNPTEENDENGDGVLKNEIDEKTLTANNEQISVNDSIISGCNENLLETLISTTKNYSSIDCRNANNVSCETTLFSGRVKTMQSINLDKSMANNTSREPKMCSTSANSYFLGDMEWMVENSKIYTGLQQGKLYCSNTKCRAKLGNWSWIGFRCNDCSAWLSPAFQVHKNKINEMQIANDKSH